MLLARKLSCDSLWAFQITTTITWAKHISLPYINTVSFSKGHCSSFHKLGCCSVYKLSVTRQDLFNILLLRLICIAFKAVRQRHNTVVQLLKTPFIIRLSSFTLLPYLLYLYCSICILSCRLPQLKILNQCMSVFFIYILYLNSLHLLWNPVLICDLKWPYFFSCEELCLH